MIIGPLMFDIGFQLSRDDQSIVARWVIKTAMVFEYLRPREQSKFYRGSEREALRTQSQIPIRTEVWIGRYGGRITPGVWGYDVSISATNVPVKGFVTTFTVGCLALQILSIRYDSDARAIVHLKPGPWMLSTREIWPSSRIVSWPPQLSFYDDGDMSLERFHRRWSFGPNVETDDFWS